MFTYHIQMAVIFQKPKVGKDYFDTVEHVKAKTG